MAPGASYIALMKGIPPVAVVPMEVSCNEYSSSNRKTFVKKERNKKHKPLVDSYLKGFVHWCLMGSGHVLFNGS